MSNFKRKVLIVNGNSQYKHMFAQMQWEVVDKLEDADLVQFTGGEDVDPKLYGEARHPTTHFNKLRDHYESEVFQRARNMGKAIAGICRGGQFVNVMCGGKLFQHVDKHGIHGTHAAIDVATKEVIQVTSTHHQMMRPGSAGEVVTYAVLSNLREHMAEGEVIDVPRSGDDQDVEAVFYRAHKCLCFQPHPEYGYRECRDYYFGLLASLLNL